MTNPERQTIPPGAFVEGRILGALAAGQAPGGGAGWSLQSTTSGEIRPEEVSLATRLSGSAPD